MEQQPNISITNAGSGDHDLLLTLKAEVTTKLDRVISDVKDLRDDTVARIGALEQEKLNIATFTTYKIQAEKDLAEAKAQAAKELKEFKDQSTKDFDDYKTATDKTIDEQGRAIAFLKNWLWYGFGFVAAIEAGIVLYQIFK